MKHPKIFFAASLVLTAIVVGRVVSTYPVFSQASDEPIHIAAGFEWLTTSGYKLDVEHPPLARIAFALSAFLKKTNVSPEIDRVLQGNQILYSNDRYVQNLAWSRAGNLPFLVLALAILTLWTRRLFGNATAIIALALFTALPSVLGHAGLTTTDAAAMSGTLAVIFAFARYLEAPSWSTAIVFGFCGAIGLLSKFSVAVYFVVAATVLVIVRVALRATPNGLKPSGALAHAAVATLVAIIGIWAGYKFEIGTLNEFRRTLFVRTPEYEAATYARVPGYEWVRPDIMERWWDYGRLADKRGAHGVDFVDWAKAAGYPSPLAGRNGNTMAGAPPPQPQTRAELLLEPLRRGLQWIAVRIRIPAPAFVVGAQFVKIHNRLGHPSFILGEHTQRGRWYYFPVVFFFKTPIAFFILSVAGIALLAIDAWRRRAAEPLAIAFIPVAMMLAVLPSNINIGVRHILPIYPFLAIAAAFAVTRLWQMSRAARTAVIVLLVWYFAATTAAHPDYLAYFNEAAGPHAEQIAVDSNLDWGQDLLRLAEVLKKQRIEKLHIAYSGTADWRRHIEGGEALDPVECTTGWIAVSEMEFHFRLSDGRFRFEWLKRFKPVRRIGKSIWLYNIPPDACSGAR